jgi:hypothetical protein
VFDNENYEKNLYRRALRALRHIPANIRQELATRDFDMYDGSTCLVGTAVRAGLARAQNLATEDIPTAGRYEPDLATELFGGKLSSWEEIYAGVMDERFPVIERAFTNALLETIPA